MADEFVVNIRDYGTIASHRPVVPREFGVPVRDGRPLEVQLDSFVAPITMPDFDMWLVPISGSNLGLPDYTRFNQPKFHAFRGSNVKRRGLSHITHVLETRVEGLPAASDVYVEPANRMVGGTTAERARVVVIDETDYSVEVMTSKDEGLFQITGLRAGEKLVVARALSGKSESFGKVTAV